MAMVNVNRKVTDQFYRYKMPKVLAKVEGKGNGIKTVIVNMVDIGKALGRPAAYPTKFFGCELGAQTQIDKKNDRFIVNGAHDAEKLQEILDGFIEKFVLCPECENPETDLTVIPKKEKINQQCLACGHQGQIDLTHRLTTFILKNPPTDDSGSTPQKGKRSRGKKENHQNGDAHPQSPTTEEPESGLSIDVNLRDSGIPGKLESESSLDDWSTDTSKEAVKNRMNSLTGGVRGLVVNEDSERSQEERMNMFFAFVKEKKASGSIEGKEKEILTEAERLDVKDKAVLVLAELLFDEDILSQVKKLRPLFLRFLISNQRAQRCLLGAFELLAGVSYPDKLLPKVAHILKAFYDFDYIEEEILVSWGEKVSKKYVSKEISTNIHKKAQPFIDWLKTAEEESSEEDDDLEVVYTKNPEPEVKKEEKEEDLDIDAI